MKPDIWCDPRVLDRYPFKDEREVWLVEAPFSMDRDRPEIIGTFLTIGGNETWRVVGCERHMIAAPIRVGEKIGLAVERASVEDLPDPYTAIYTGDGQASRALLPIGKVKFFDRDGKARPLSVGR